MAFTKLNPRALASSLLVLSCLHSVSGMSGWAGCLDGQDVFASIKENSLSGELIAELGTEAAIEGVHWSLEGKDADWFLLEDRSILLNTSADKILDREALGSVLMAQLVCYEDDIFQGNHRILVEIINENDNSPVFAEDTVQVVHINELTPVNAAVLHLQATDADNDELIYLIDQASPGAEYFEVVLPNSGEVVLAKPLDYETKTQIVLTVYATEMSTAERFNTSINITIHVLDGDDQYPYFEPCMLLFEDETNRICTSPVYTVNVTEGEEDIVLDFSPGPIHAVDGDRGLNAPVSYAILSGDDEGYFRMDKDTGELRLTRGVTDRLTTPALQLQVMAYQDNDPRKYSLATAVVRVLAVNRFHPEFDVSEYRGFVTAGKSPASLVNTYGSKALILHVQDQDFRQGLNPMICFALSPTSNHTDKYQVTHEGLLIARQSQLKPKQRHILEVMAVDQESGDTTFATVVVEVLSEGQLIPHSAFGDGRLTGCTVGKALFLSMVFMTATGCVVWIIMWLKKKHRVKRDPLERGCVAQGKHPNVSLRWFQLVSHGGAMPHMDEVPCISEEYGTCNPSFSFPEKQDTRTHGDAPTSGGTTPTQTGVTATDAACSSAASNASASKSFPSSSASNPATVVVNAGYTAQGDAPVSENHDSPFNATLEPPETQLYTTPCPADQGADATPPLTRPTSRSTIIDELVDPVASPSSQCSVPCSLTRIASAEIDKPFRKPRVKTPPYSPLLTSPLPKQTSSPPPTPGQSPVKATLVHIDATPPDSPTPEQASGTLGAEEDQPSTSLDQTEEPIPPDGTAGAGSPSQGRRLSSISAKTLDGQAVGDEDDDGFLGDEDADKNSGGEEELEPDEEELLRVLARCNPVFITFSK